MLLPNTNNSDFNGYVAIEVAMIKGDGISHTLQFVTFDGVNRVNG